MPETLVKPANTVKTKASRERYAILTPLDTTRGIYKVYTDFEASTLQQIKSSDVVFTPTKICKILSVDIEAIIFGLSLGSEFYYSEPKDDELPLNALNEIYIYESLGGTQTFYGTVKQFIDRNAQKNTQE